MSPRPGITMSGLPGKFARCNENRHPSSWSFERTIRSGVVSRLLTACMHARRSAELRLSGMAYANAFFGSALFEVVLRPATASSSYTGVRMFLSSQRMTGTHTPSPKPNRD